MDTKLGICRDSLRRAVGRVNQHRLRALREVSNRRFCFDPLSLSPYQQVLETAVRATSHESQEVGQAEAVEQSHPVNLSASLCLRAIGFQVETLHPERGELVDHQSSSGCVVAIVGLSRAARGGCASLH